MPKLTNETPERFEAIKKLLEDTEKQLSHHDLLVKVTELKRELREALEEINRHHKDFDRWEEMADNANRRVKILEKQLSTSLANNLCPDHRDKQYGKPCLACTIETLERKLARTEEHLRLRILQAEGYKNGDTSKCREAFYALQKFEKENTNAPG